MHRFLVALTTSKSLSISKPRTSRVQDVSGQMEADTINRIRIFLKSEIIHPLQM